MKTILKLQLLNKTLKVIFLCSVLICFNSSHGQHLQSLFSPVGGTQFDETVFSHRYYGASSLKDYLSDLILIQKSLLGHEDRLYDLIGELDFVTMHGYELPESIIEYGILESGQVYLIYAVKLFSPSVLSSYEEVAFVRLPTHKKNTQGIHESIDFSNIASDVEWNKVQVQLQTAKRFRNFKKGKLLKKKYEQVIDGVLMEDFLSRLETEISRLKIITTQADKRSPISLATNKFSITPSLSGMAYDNTSRQHSRAAQGEIISALLFEEPSSHTVTRMEYIIGIDGESLPEVSVERLLPARISPPTHIGLFDTFRSSEESLNRARAMTNRYFPDLISTHACQKYFKK